MNTNTEQAALARQVADDIETHAQWFNQRAWAHKEGGDYPCGTPSCVAGFTVWRDIRNTFPHYADEDVEAELARMLDEEAGMGGGSIKETAAKVLGLSEAQASRMFEEAPYDGEAGPDAGCEAQEAARMLRSYADDGEVCWPERTRKAG